jgi:hypothetical protein
MEEKAKDGKGEGWGTEIKIIFFWEFLEIVASSLYSKTDKVVLGGVRDVFKNLVEVIQITWNCSFIERLQKIYRDGVKEK